MFTPILAKSWRVNQIFKKAAFKRVVIKDHRLLTLVGINVMIDIIFMILWQTVDPLQHRCVPLIPQGLKSPSYINVTDIIIIVPACNCNFYPIWMSCLFIYKGTIMVYGLYIAWEIRNITLPSMDEAKPTIIIIFTIIITCSSTIPISHLIKEWPVAAKSYNIMAIWLCTLITQCTIFVPKVLLWHKNQDDKIHLTVAQQVIYSNNDSSYEEISHLVVENSALKKSLQEKEQLIQNLQHHLTTAKDKLMEISSEDVNQVISVDVDLALNCPPSDYQKSSHLPLQGCETDTNSNGGTDFYPASCPLSLDQSINPTIYKCQNINYLYQSQLRQMKRKNSTKSVQSSLHSVTTEFKLAQLRESITNELNQAHSLSFTLRDSISKDLNISHKENTWVQDAIPVKRTDIAGSIAQSYDLSDDSDTYSYVSSYVPSWTSPYSLSTPAHQNVYASSDSLTTLGNDKLYPALHNNSKHKHRIKKHHHNSHKRELRKKVYIINDTKAIAREHLEGQECPQVTLSQDTIV